VPQVEDIVAKIARIPPKHVTSSDKELLRNLERDLKLTVFGQDAAIDSLSTAIKLSRAGLKSPDKPVGSFLFAARGPPEQLVRDILDVRVGMDGIEDLDVRIPF
ncbi:hypothetical protein LUU93_21580, partial [Flavobacterium sp. SCIV07]|nr:hypothetical protein [Flavobacterium soyae]